MPPRYPPYTYSNVQWPQQLYYPQQYAQQWGYQYPQQAYAGGPPAGNPYPGYGYPSPRQKKKRHTSLTPPPDVELHELLGGRFRPTAVWDVTQDPSHVRQVTQRGTEKVPTALLREPATNPGAHFMLIVCDSIPWDIPIKLERGEEVTVGILMEAIHNELQVPLTREEWEEESHNSRKKIHRAMCNRLARSPPAYKVDGHVKRIDFLGDKTFFMGLKPQGPPDAPEAWLLKLGSLPRK